MRKSLIIIIITAIIPILISICIILVFNKKNKVNRPIELAIQNHYNSFKLRNELRQNSDDLTRMERKYRFTGDPLYKEYFQQILDIHNGLSPRCSL